MISTKLNINNVEYIVRAKNKSELDKAVEFLYDCHEHKMAVLESKLSQELDNVLVSRLGEPEEPIAAEPAIETPVELPKIVQSTEKQTPPLKKSPAKSKNAGKTMAKPVDNKSVDLGKIGKGR